MQSIKVLLLVMVFCQVCGSATAQANTTHTVKPPAIILKLDDFGSNASFKCAEILDFLAAQKIKAGLGVVAGWLDSTALTVYGKYLDKTDTQGVHLFEIWNHGLFHSNNNPPANNAEFKGTGYAFQKNSLELADAFVKAYLDVQMHSFGAPFNALDSITTQVLSENSQYKVILFGGPEIMPRGILNMDHRVDMEITPGMVNYAHFVKQYTSHVKRYSDYMVLQGHPNQWDSNRVQEFKKVIGYLLAQGCVFTLPYEYYTNNKSR